MTVTPWPYTTPLRCRHGVGHCPSVTPARRATESARRCHRNDAAQAVAQERVGHRGGRCGGCLRQRRHPGASDRGVRGVLPARVWDLCHQRREGRRGGPSPSSQALPPDRRRRDRCSFRDGPRAVAGARRHSAVRRHRSATRARRPRVRRAHAVVHTRVAACDRVRHHRGGGRVRAPCRGGRRRGPRDPLALVPARGDRARRCSWPPPSATRS